MTPTQRLLTAARDYIAEKPEHWCQGKSGYERGNKRTVDKYDGPCCASGVITLTLDRAGYAIHAGVGLRLIRPFVEAIGGQRLPSWNDAPGRTREEVIAAFDRAIELAG